MRVRHVEIKNFRGIKTLSWNVKGNFSCIIGPGDTCKTTILTAIDYALSPRSSLIISDSDFFDQDIDRNIIIQVTLTDWDEARAEIRRLLQESKFAQYISGLNETGPLDEPVAGGPVALSISLRVDKSLEPRWSVIRGRDDSEEKDRKVIYASDREILGLSRIDIFSDFQFTWGRNSIVSRLSAGNDGNLNTVLSDLIRDMRQCDISQDRCIIDCQDVADTIRRDALESGVNLSDLSPKIDLQRQHIGTGALSLHENNVPLRSKGTGTKRLIGAAMQMKLNDGKNISIIDEIEIGLEPHRIRGLIYKLKNSNQQIFTTTHSPVVIRELIVNDNELYICKRNSSGNVTLQSLAVVPDIQGQVRKNAEAFLGNKIIICEGITEIGCLRAYDLFRFNRSDPAIWSLATSYLDCGGANKIKRTCEKFISLGYKTAVFCDNDAPDQISEEDIRSLREAGAHICQWDSGKSTERQLFSDTPWQYIPDLLQAICASNDSLEHAEILNSIITDSRIQPRSLGSESASWPDLAILRQVMGDLAHSGKWIKRIAYAQEVFTFALPNLPIDSTIRSRLNALYSWIQANV